jgi:hypothetical protein
MLLLRETRLSLMDFKQFMRRRYASGNAFDEMPMLFLTFAHT